MKITRSNNLSLDKFIEWALYDKDTGYYMKKILLAKKAILLQRQISLDYFQK